MNRPLAVLLLCGASATPLVALAQAAVPDAQVLDRVTVSARLREENLTDVPASIAVVGGEALKEEGRFNIGDLDSRVSNLQLGDLNGSPVIYLRGVGGGGRQVGFEPRTGVTVDGVFMNAPPMSNALLLDLERVEVVRGPQGSLAGQNTVAGSIQMVTRTPGEQFGIEALARSDSQQTHRLASAINLPMADGRVRTRISASVADGAGEVVDQTTGARADAFKDAAVRARTLVLLRDDLTLDLSADTAAHFDDFPTGEPPSGTGGSGPAVPAGPYSIAVNSPQRNDLRQSGVSATLSYQIPQGTFTSISAWRDSQRDWLIDLDYSAADILLADFFDEYSRFSQELRFASITQANGFAWLAGLYAFEQRAIRWRSRRWGRSAPRCNQGIASTPVRARAIARWRHTARSASRPSSGCGWMRACARCTQTASSTTSNSPAKAFSRSALPTPQRHARTIKRPCCCPTSP